MKILFFAPHSALWVHAFPEALVAEALAQQGHRVLYVTCGGEFRRFCVPMSAFGLSPRTPDDEREKVCRLCRDARDVLRSRFGFEGYDVLSRLGPLEREQIERLVESTTWDNALELRLHGVEVGRLALYELLLAKKKQDLQFTDDEWEEYLVHLRNSLASLVACDRIFEEERPDRLVVYNSLYSVNHVAYRLAELRGIPAYFLHAGGNASRRLETLLLGRGDGVRFYDRLLAFWRGIRAVPCGAALLGPVTDHFIELLRGRQVFVYSAPRSGGVDLRARFGIRSDQKVLVATLSSPDERFAAETVGVLRKADDPVFPTQVAWIRALLRFATPRPDLFVIIRVHPREFPNKREAVKSQHARLLEEAFEGLPDNAAVNWPSDGVSLYDLAEVADVFLNAWSAAGKEMSLLGLPVVLFSAQQQVYPSDLNYVGTSEHDYFEKVGQALAEGWSTERMRATYRWYALEYERATIDIRESFPQSLARRGAQPRRLLDRILTRIDPRLKWRVDCLLRRRLAAAGLIDRIVREGHDSLLDVDEWNANGSVEDETRVLRREVRRLLHALDAGETSARRGSLSERLQGFVRGA